MSIRVALHHQTVYRYDRKIELGAQVIRLRPAVHCRTPIESYSLKVTPTEHYLNWQQDPHGNYLARCIFHEKVAQLSVEVDLVAKLAAINPFDFFLEPDAEQYPFEYSAAVADDLKPYLTGNQTGAKFHGLLARIDRTPRKTIDFLVELNQLLEQEVDYLVRLEPGIQSPEETLESQSGSCRDSAWLLVEVLRHLGFAARFVSGYLIQLTADVPPLEGPAGPSADFTDLHAWTEVYLPGAGWVGLDPTSGLLAGEGHIPLACTPQPISAAPITGTLEDCEAQFEVEMSIERVHEDPRVTKPYSEPQWERIVALGHQIDERLVANDVRLTMGGEPTFVSLDAEDGDEWQTAALGPHKRRLATELLWRLKDRFAPGGLLHFGQGKWYPGEPLPRWSLQCYWRKDGQPLWQDPALFAKEGVDYGHTTEHAERFAHALAERLGVDPAHAIPAREDPLYYLWRERRLPPNVDLRDPQLEDEAERARLARVLEQGLTSPVGQVLPLQFRWWDATARWQSGPWAVRSEDLFLLPGDSPLGYRLPLESLLQTSPEIYPRYLFEADPGATTSNLPPSDLLHNRLHPAAAGVQRRVLQTAAVGGSGPSEIPSSCHEPPYAAASFLPASVDALPEEQIIRTALCVEPRDGRLHIFLPPVDRAEVYVDLIAAIEHTSAALELPIVLEGYLPPHHDNLAQLQVTPDPGVIEVNVHPAESWEQLVQITTGVYEDARHTRLGTEKFDLDGSHTGTGGGNHVVLGGATPSDSPWLRRPDLLKSFVGYWHNHPSLSYLFSGKFIGPTSQAPRADEARADALYELKIALEQIQPDCQAPPWLVDRVFRHLLTDGTGNTHRAEFCIDKLFSPDTSAGRLGLVEFRALEMPPHARMSLTQQLLLRALVVKFWEEPYAESLVAWKTALHDRWMLPHFVWQDFEDVVADLGRAKMPLETEWFAAHHEFRFPQIGTFTHRGIYVELRRAIEPWYVLGEENAGGQTARYVDSSVERLQVKVQGFTDPRYLLACNGRGVPLHPTGVEGEFVAGVRYRAWQPPSCLHPTLGVDAPLVFDVVDRWQGRSIGGCQYHVGHPGGLNAATFPVNALEAESRRATRFSGFGHTPGPVKITPPQPNPDFPLTLDLRRGRYESKIKI